MRLISMSELRNSSPGFRNTCRKLQWGPFGHFFWWYNPTRSKRYSSEYVHNRNYWATATTIFIALTMTKMHKSQVLQQSYITCISQRCICKLISSWQVLTTNCQFPTTDTGKPTWQLSSSVPTTIKLCKCFKCLLSTNTPKTTHLWHCLLIFQVRSGLHVKDYSVTGQVFWMDIV